MSFFNFEPVQLTLDLVADDCQLEQDYQDYLWVNGLSREQVTYNEWFYDWRT